MSPGFGIRQVIGGVTRARNRLWEADVIKGDREVGRAYGV